MIQNNGGPLPDIILLTLCDYQSETTRLSPMYSSMEFYLGCY